MKRFNRKRLKIFCNENGITLLEVLLSITILTIILISLMSIFQQMGVFNQKNEDKSQAVNDAKQILLEWQSNQDLKTFLSNPTLNEIPDAITERDTYFYAEKDRGNEKEIVNIAKDSDLASEPVKAHQIHVQLLDENNTVIGERFGYIIVEE
ncbi:prepilin-type N-terminal cleavage/methylation domain-containing protein [Ornithinibacillus salinisoli]|uniref:Prepilin-type N-terminal cleavage/methylation domain-containing protein n=1 Tax=Ornithinibacillus salinisoli TaxID=1848459 RepID=A0ABW4W4Q9_9BACI